MGEKLSILDVKSRDSDMRWYNVEVQARPDRWWPVIGTGAKQMSCRQQWLTDQHFQEMP